MLDARTFIAGRAHPHEVPQEVRCRCMRRDMAAEQLASAEDVELPEPWGLLVSVETGEEEERLPISSERFTIGRANGVHTHCGVGVGGHIKAYPLSPTDVDLVLSDNKYVSSHHCTLQLDEDGVIWLKDTRQENN